ncbi:MAG: DUF4231 domain-containing protein [Lachnospiraceae bacterium]
MNKNINIDEYISTRVNNQIEWYEKKARSCQRKYTISQTIEIILAALIPLLSSYANDFKMVGFIVGVFGAAIAIIKSLGKLHKWPENWIGYRTACDLLRYQKVLFETHSAPYNTKPESVENIFVHNIEQIISSEHNQWKSFNLEAQDKDETEQGEA